MRLPPGMRFVEVADFSLESTRRLKELLNFTFVINSHSPATLPQTLLMHIKSIS